MADRLKSVSKAHTRYKTAAGMLVPGATTVTGLLNKPQLVRWANRLGLEGIDSSKYTDEAAAIGTLAHAMVLEHLTKEELDRTTFSAAQIDQAENSVLSFLEWKKQHDIIPIACETKYVCDDIPFLAPDGEMKMVGYGGTVDCYCMLDGKGTLLDFKTGSGIYNEYFVQVAAYAELLKKAGLPVEECRILRIGRSEDEGFEDRSVPNTERYYEIFKSLLNVYFLKKELGWKG